MKTLDEILKDAQYCSSWYTRSLRWNPPNIDTRLSQVGINIEGWIAEDVVGNPICVKVDVEHTFIQDGDNVKIAFEI